MRIGDFTNQISLSSLNSVGQAITRNLRRLSSGQRLTSPSEDVAAFSQGGILEASFRGLAQRIRNVNSSLGLLETSGSAISSQVEIVNKMKELAVRASSDTLSPADRTGISKEILSLQEEFQRISQHTEFNGIHLLDGSSGALTLGDGVNLSSINTSSAQSFKKVTGNGNFASLTTVDQNNSDATNFVLNDQNHDGILDQIVIDTTADAISVYIGDGQGHFTFSRSTAIGATDTYRQWADFDDDGNMDALITTSSGLKIAYGNADGGFDTVATGITSLNPAYVGDVDADGKTDIVTLETDTDTTILFSSYRNQGDRTFGLFSRFDTNTNFAPNGFKLGDLNGDGFVDIVETGSLSTNALIRLNDGKGRFSISQTLALPTNGTAFVDLVDMNNDGDKEIVLLFSSLFGANKGVGIYDNNGSGTFSLIATYGIGGVAGSDIKTADLNGDGAKDVVVSSSNLDAYLIFLNNGDGTLSAATTLRSATTISGFYIADINGDGAQDLFSRDVTLDEFSLHLGLTQEQSALSLLDVNSSAEARDLLGVLDKAQNKLLKSLSEISTAQSTLEFQVAWLSNQSENISFAKDALLSTDLALETAELVKNQIRQQAMLAAHAQAIQSRQLLLKLFQNL